eukprot:751024-Hanusia_phi.AAC.3
MPHQVGSTISTFTKDIISAEQQKTTLIDVYTSHSAYRDEDQNTDCAAGVRFKPLTSYHLQQSGHLLFLLILDVQVHRRAYENKCVEYNHADVLNLNVPDEHSDEKLQETGDSESPPPSSLLLLLLTC